MRHRFFYLVFVFFISCEYTTLNTEGGIESSCDGRINFSYTFCCEDYYKNGNIELEYCFDNSIIHGVYRKYHKNGSLFFEIILDHEKLINISKYYSINGDELTNPDFKNGNGTVKCYYPTGKVYSVGNYRNGLREGDWVIYTEWGDTLSYDKYIAGRLDGLGEIKFWPMI